MLEIFAFHIYHFTEKNLKTIFFLSTSLILSYKLEPIN